MTDINYKEILENQAEEIKNLHIRIQKLEKIVLLKNNRNAGRNPIFTNEDKELIKQRYEKLQSSRKVAEEFGVSKTTILNIIKNEKSSKE